MEFVADLYPHSGLLPSDPVERAKARFFVDVVNTKVGQVYVKHFYTGGASPLAAVIPGLEAVEALLPTDKVFAVGDNFTVADAAVAPFLLQLGVYISLHDEEGVGLHSAVRSSLVCQSTPRLSRSIQVSRAHGMSLRFVNVFAYQKSTADIFSSRNI
jgi:glutathione S-transferase